MVTVALMSSLSLARPAHRCLLRLGAQGDDAAQDLRDNLSGFAGRDGWLWQNRANPCSCRRSHDRLG